jgi:hypothetical protein
MLLAVAVLGLSSSLLVACGDRSGLIPAQAASELKDDLDKASLAVEGGHCEQAQGYVRDAISKANDLDESVNRGLRQNLNVGLQHVQDRVSQDCGRTTPTTPTTPTETTPTQTTTETTPPTPPPTTTTPPPTPTTPSEGNGGTPPSGVIGGDGSGDSGGSGGNGNGGNGNGGNGTGGSGSGDNG